MQRIALVVMLLALAGCDSAGPDVDPAGLYALVTLNGAALPYRSGASETTGAEITLRPNRTFAYWLSSLEHTSPGQTVPRMVEASGSYTFDESSVTLTTQGGIGGSGSVTAAFDGETLTFEDQTGVAIYSRQE